MRRFFGVLLAKPLDDVERSEVIGWLGPHLFELFSSQQVADQRHGLEVGRRVAAAEGSTPDLVIAGAMHDVGKRHSGLGPLGRSVATVLIFVRLPLTRRMALYRDHGKVGAAELEALGAPQVAVEFARHHQYGRPEGFPVEAWRTLRSADLDL